MAFDVAPGAAGGAVEAMRVLSIGGLSVTMPHKADVAAAVDALSGAAVDLRAVNCVQPHEGRLIGHNTDGQGLLDALGRDHGIDVSGMACLVIGGGGAARAVALALGGHGASRVGVANRTSSRAAEVADLAGPTGEVCGTDAAGEYDLIVNATPIGMAGTPTAAALPLDVEQLHDGQVVVDLVYNPVETPLLAAARERGLTAVDGIGMLVGQAALAFGLWTGRDAPLSEMAAAARGAIANLQG